MPPAKKPITQTPSKPDLTTPKPADEQPDTTSLTTDALPAPTRVIEPHVDPPPVDVVDVEVSSPGFMPRVEYDGASELQYWWTPVTAAQAAAAYKAAQPALATMATANLITLNPNYVPSS